MQTFLRNNPAPYAVVAAVLATAVLGTTFLAFEPMIALGITDTFTVRQEVQSEIAFQTPPNNVTMTPALQGLTGGNSLGTSTVAINTNNPTGYNMSIAFEDVTAMQGENLTSDIANYDPAVGATPDFAFTVGPNSAEFGYTVNSVTTPGDVDDRFKDSGAACNTGAGTTVNACWYGVADATSPVVIIDRTTATPGTGATSTIVFQVGITANPVPAIETGFYNATATLTAVTNP